MRKIFAGWLGLALATTLMSSQAVAQVHKASWYGFKPWDGRKTASGEVFRTYGLTTASNSHKMGTMLRVTNVVNGKSVVVKVTDTGGFAKYGRTLDLLQGAFQKITPLSQGIVRVKIEVLK